MLEFILLQTDAVAEAVVPTEEKLSILSLYLTKVVFGLPFLYLSCQLSSFLFL